MTADDDRDRFATGRGLRAFADLRGGKNDALIGRRLGDYVVTGFIAEGGMSQVYAATRNDGSFERDVALKVSPVSGVSSDLRERFLREQALLATLNHPHITQLYDAHVTEEGWPYFVMERVDGVPLTEHCVRNGLNIDQRVALFNDVVKAVSYAHARLIIHRDIKPSNVLVDKRGGIKLLDFGIARLVETDATQTARGPMTPRYASPEQLLGRHVTVSSDIYQLGLLLAEVLLDRPFFEDDKLTAAIERAASGSPALLTADDRRRLPKDLVLVIEQCLRAAPEERYVGASDLSDDLSAFLAGFPVRAAGQGAGYRFRKLVGRNKGASTLIVGTVLAGIAATAWYTWQLDNARQLAELNAVQASREAEKANQVAEFLKELLAAAKPSNARGEDITVSQVLDVGVERVRTELEEPELKANLLEIMGDVYTDLGEFERAEALLQESIAIHREAGMSVTLASALEEYGQLLRTRGDWLASIPVLEEALSIAAEIPGDASLGQQAGILNSLGFTASKLNRFAEAEGNYRAALMIRQQLHGPEHTVTAQTLSGLGLLLYKTAQYEESVDLMQQALKIADRELGPYHPVISTRALNLASAYLRMGQFGEAETLIRRAIGIDEHIYGPDHHYVASGYLSLAAVYREQLDFPKAAETLEAALPIETAALGDQHVDTGQTRVTLAYYYAKVGNFREAAELIAEAQEIFDNEGLEEHHYVLQLMRSRGVLAQEVAAYEEALAHYEQALSMANRMYGPDHHRADLVAGAARANASLQRYQASSVLYADAVERMEKESTLARPLLIRTRQEYADVLEKGGEAEKARLVRQSTNALIAASSEPSN